MKRSIAILFLLICYYSSAQQHFEYYYDNAGNRVKRKYFVNRLANPETAIDSSAAVENKFGIRVFPNPAKDKININVSSQEEGVSATIYLLDEQGKVLLMKEQKAELEELDISTLKAGIYYIKVYVKEEWVGYKVVKM
jgi:hypothetical protein